MTVRTKTKAQRSRKTYSERLDCGTRCWQCHRRLRLEPPPLPEGKHDPPSQGEPGGLKNSRWARVTIRCAYCFKTFCPGCAREHFTPQHHSGPGDPVAVKRVLAYVVTIGGAPIKVSLDREDAVDLAGRVKREQERIGEER